MALTIAIDAMGGDHAPQVVVAGINMARRRHADLEFLLFGEQATVTSLVQTHPGLAERVTIVHTPNRVEADAKPSQALRHGRGGY